MTGPGSAVTGPCAPAARRYVAVNLENAGLGNRVRFTLSVAALARSHGMDFDYEWPVDNRFGGSFDELWQFRPPAPAGTYQVTHDVTDARFPCPAAGDGGTGDIVVRSHQALRGADGTTSWARLLRELAPTAAVAESMSRLGERLPQEWVGVQVRAHPRSHPRSLAESPVDWFLDRMARMRDRDNTVGFVVSCDEPGAQARILARFPEAVAQTDKGPYNSAYALRSAVVDLYALAASTHILAPHYSSFAELAWELSGRAQVLETSQEVRPVESGEGCLRTGRQAFGLSARPATAGAPVPLSRS